MDNVIVVEIVHSSHDLLDSLGSIELGKLSLVADSVEKLSASCQLCDDVKLVLYYVSSVSPVALAANLGRCR